MCSQKRFIRMTKSGIGLGGKRKTAERLMLGKSALIMDCLQWKSVCGCFLPRFIILLQYIECKSKQCSIPNDQVTHLCGQIIICRLLFMVMGIGRLAVSVHSLSINNTSATAGGLHMRLRVRINSFRVGTDAIGPLSGTY